MIPCMIAALLPARHSCASPTPQGAARLQHLGVQDNFHRSRTKSQRWIMMSLVFPVKIMDITDITLKNWPEQKYMFFGWKFCHVVPKLDEIHHLFPAAESLLSSACCSTAPIFSKACISGEDQIAWEIWRFPKSCGYPNQFRLRISSYSWMVCNGNSFYK